MKNNYERVVRHRRSHNREPHVWFEFAHGYFRAVRTFPEIRANHNDARDPELREYRVKVRGCRNRYALDSWNDFPNSRQMGKSWKDYTKNKKQWESKGAIKEPDLNSPWLNLLRAMDPELL